MSNVEVIKIKELDPDIIPPSTATYKNPDQGGSKIVVVGKPGCFSPGTPILMFNGTIKKVEDVMVGDQLMGPDSKPRTVLELCHNEQEMFKILPQKGESYTVNLNHKLVLQARSQVGKYKKGDVIEITVDDFLKQTRAWKWKWLVFRTGVEFENKPVELDPYLLGHWVVQTNQNPSSDEEVELIVDQFLSKLQRTQQWIDYDSKELSYILDKHNLFADKRIPQHYQVNSRENRLALIAGIIDSNGYYDTRGNGYVIIHPRESLVDDLVFVARSLGLAADKRSYVKLNSDSHEEIWYQTFITGNIEDIPCRRNPTYKPRKSNKNHLVSTFRIIPQGHGEYFGFTIDGDHRFLLGSFDVVRNTGKTTLISSLLYAKKHIFPVAMVMSGTEDSNHFYRSVMPSTFVFNNYDEPQLEKFIKRQKIAKEHLENPWAIVILDDCTDDAALFRKPLQNGMYKRGRHWKMWYILSLQYGMDVRPVIRTNVDGVFILREPNLRNRRVMYENYAAIIPDFKLFCDILDQITNDYTALYIHNATKSNDWRECVFWYKAKPIPPDFKFGCEEYHDFHKQRYNPDYVDPITV